MDMTLKIMRIKKGITQWELSKQTNIPNYKISLIENGHIEPSEQEKKKLARALKVKITELFPENQRNGGL